MPDLSVTVHRACSLIGLRALHDDAMNSVIRFSLLSCEVPDLPQARGDFDFKDVVGVPRDVVREVMDSVTEGAGAGAGTGSLRWRCQGAVWKVGGADGGDLRRGTI